MFNRSKVLALLSSASLLVGSAAASLAQSTVTVDYASSATAFKDGITPLVSTVLPIAVGIMVIFKGPALFKKLVSKFTS